MLKIYGSMLCRDCVMCREDLDRAGVSYEYLDFSESLLHLKEFLALRDSREEFASIRESGKIGIPCILDDEKLSFDWEDYM